MRDRLPLELIVAGSWDNNFLLQKRIVFFLLTNSRGRAVAGEDCGFGGEGEEGGADAVDECIEIATGKVCAAYAAGEEDIAGDDPVAGGIVERYAAGGVAGCVEYLQDIIAKLHGLAGGDVGCGFGNVAEVEAEECGGAGGHFEDFGLLLVEAEGYVVLVHKGLHAEDVIEVGVGVDDGLGL